MWKELWIIHGFELVSWWTYVRVHDIKLNNSGKKWCSWEDCEVMLIRDDFF